MNIFGTIVFEEFRKFIAPIEYIIIGVIVYYGFKTIVKVILNKKTLKKRHHQKRAETITSLFVNIFKYIVMIIVALLILANFGIDIRGIIAGLGVTAAIVGLAFQDIAKDFLSGMTIIGEDWYEIGDTVVINNFLGEVIFIGLRTTRLRSYKGETMIINNRNITNVINHNLHNSLAIVEVPVSKKENPAKVTKILNGLADKIDGTIPKAKGKLELLGIERLTNEAAIYKLIMPVASTEQYGIQRQLLEIIKQELTSKKIKMPMQEIEVINGK